MQGNEQSAERPEQQGHETRKHLIRAALLVGWGLVLAVQVSQTVRHPSTSNLIVSAAFCLLFLVVNVNLFLVGWLGSRSWRRVSTKLHGAAYLSEFHNLPNRNYVLAELRREMPRARTHSAPFVLIQLSLENIDSVRERRGDQIARVPIFLTAALSNSGCREGFQFAERETRRLLVCRHQSLIVQCDCQHGNRLGRGTGEVVEHPPLVRLLLALRQTFIVAWIPIFAKRVKLFARHIALQTQSLRARADPVAGADFARRVVIVLRQMLVKILLGIRQILLSYGSKHTRARYRIFKTALRVLRTNSGHCPATFAHGHCAVPQRAVWRKLGQPRCSCYTKSTCPMCLSSAQARREMHPPLCKGCSVLNGAALGEMYDFIKPSGTQ